MRVRVHDPTFSGTRNPVAHQADRASAQASTERRRILVIEDNLLAAQSLRMLLTETGHAVEVAHNGPDGIEVARRFRPEIVLCDIGLPGLDGYAVARVLREEPGLTGVYNRGKRLWSNTDQRRIGRRI